MVKPLNTPSLELTKYLVIHWQNREQVVSFPAHLKHMEVLRYLLREHPQLKLISAGFFIREPDAFWCGGCSESLQVTSRPEDKPLIESFLQNPDREAWDLTRLATEAASSINR